MLSPFLHVYMSASNSCQVFQTLTTVDWSKAAVPDIMAMGGGNNDKSGLQHGQMRKAWRLVVTYP